MERIWKEAGVALNFPGGNEETHEKPIGTAGLRAGI
jgi:hypothetical protein